MNHMFWCAASSNDDDADLKEAKWVSITNHIMDKHSGHENHLFPKCLHGRLHGREWKKSGSNQVNYVELGIGLKGLSCKVFLHTYSRMHMCISFAGTQPYENLRELLTKKSLLKDIRQMSGQHATSSLEAFHSVQNHFAAKLLAFSYHGMRSRYYAPQV